MFTIITQRVALSAASLFFCFTVIAQPWKSPLKIAHSTDGLVFDLPAVFQDSAGVPCVIRWKGDTLICAFQWFRAPQNSPTWDRVAVKYSYDAGLSWTTPTPIVVSGLPAVYQRPFDPTLVVFGGDSLRIYFSSSEGLPPVGQDSVINCYSAKSVDGIHYVFEPGPRVDHPGRRLIDPAVTFFNGVWHYTAPVGAPQEGAHHYISTDGLAFLPVPVIPSDNTHNWTGNLLVDQSGKLRFYGSGQKIWLNSSSNGGMWDGFINTNIPGGDPSVVQIPGQGFWMVYVGMPYATGVEDILQESIVLTAFPNPAGAELHLNANFPLEGSLIRIVDMQGALRYQGVYDATPIDTQFLAPGLYCVEIQDHKRLVKARFVKS